MAVSLRHLLGEQRKCMDGGPRLPSRLMTHWRHNDRKREKLGGGPPYMQLLRAVYANFTRSKEEVRE